MPQVIAIESTTELRTAGLAMAEVASAIQHAVTTLANTLDLIGDPIQVTEQSGETTVRAGVSARPPWGDDSHGTTFADGPTGYVALSTNLLQGGFDTARTLTEFATGMKRAAGVTESGEHDSATLFR
ncbi:hypothetical protein [Nocardia sp. NPDC003979]